MQVCTSVQTDNHASTSPLSFFTGRMPFLLPNQQRQSTEGELHAIINCEQNDQGALITGGPVARTLGIVWVVCNPLITQFGQHY